jgi:hypothetical protein
VADNLARALVALPTDLAAADPVLRNVIVGVQANDRELQSVLERHGVKRIASLSKPFNADFYRRRRKSTIFELCPREIRRRTRVVGAFPDGNSALNLAAARLRHIAGTRLSQHAAAQARQRHDRLTGAGHRPKCERFWTQPTVRNEASGGAGGIRTVGTHPPPLAGNSVQNN